jgi:hypothetical protein
MTDIPIATAATAYDDPSTGRTIILEFNQGLWFGDRMANSLVNPNQVRSHGIQLCDDPWDPHQSLSIQDPETGTEVPLEYGASIVFANTRAPTLEELQSNLLTIVMTGEVWNPSEEGSTPKSRELEERASLIASVHLRRTGYAGSITKGTTTPS